MSRTPKNPLVSFRAPTAVLDEIRSRQDVLSAQMEAEGDAPLGSVAKRDLIRYYQVVRDELRKLPLSRNEVLLVLDAMNGVLVDTPGMYRGAVVLDVADHIRLNGADAKWDVDGDVLISTLEAMSPGTLMALVDLAERFWLRADEDTDAVLRDLGVREWIHEEG